MDRTPHVRLKQGQTRRSDLAIRASRVLASQSVYDRTAEGTPRRFILQHRLEALLRVLTPAELAFYHHEVAVLTGQDYR